MREESLEKEETLKRMGKEGKGMASKEKEEFEGGRRRERDRGSKGLVGGLISFFFSFLFLYIGYDRLLVFY